MAKYKRTAPQGTDTTAQSANDFRNNNRVIGRVNEVDHVKENEDDQGKHRTVTLPHQSAAPTTAANETAIYTKTGSPSKVYVRPESDGTEVAILTDKWLDPGLRLEAWVAFDDNGTILKVQRNVPGEVDPVDLPIASNNITVTKTGIGRYTLAFSPALSTANYFPIFQHMDNLRSGGILAMTLQPLNGTYATTCTSSQLLVRGYSTLAPNNEVRIAKEG